MVEMGPKANEQLEEARKVYEMAPPQREQSAHDYLPAWLEPYIPGIYKSDQDDPVVWAKLFTPDAGWTWYVTEHTQDDCFGYVVGLAKEWGYFSLREIASVRGPFGLKIERDLWWRPKLASQVLLEERG
jgi:hypothetical protein